MLNQIKSAYALLTPLFGWKGNSLKRSLAAAAILAGNIIASLTIVAVNTSVDSLIGVVTGTSLTYSIFFRHLLNCFAHIGVYAAMRVANFAMASWLGDSLSYALSKRLSKQWINSQSYFGIKFVEKPGDEPANPANILGKDAETIGRKIATLSDSFATSAFNFIIGTYQLWQLSIPLSVNFMSMSFVVPGYMFIGALTYAGAYHLLASAVGKRLRSHVAELSRRKDTFIAHLHHMHNHGEEIALRKGQQREEKQLNRHLKDFVLIKAAKRYVSSSLFFVETMHSQATTMLGLTLAAPGIIQGKIEGFMAFSIADYFEHIVKFFTWHHDNVEDLTDIKVASERLAAFQALMSEWEATLAKKDTQTQKGHTFGIKGLNINKPNGEAILENAKIDIPNGQATVIQGPSGIGKSTLFRALANVWPYTSGVITLPNDNTKMYFIPQRPYFPYRGSITQALAYPNDNLSQADERKAVKLMRALNFSQDTIKRRHENTEWENILSGGEQQRIAIIGAILHKPDILFMDEGTSAIDSMNREIVKQTLKRELKDSTIIAIDHHIGSQDGLHPFYNNRLRMSAASQEKGPAQVRLEVFKP